MTVEARSRVEGRRCTVAWDTACGLASSQPVPDAPSVAALAAERYVRDWRLGVGKAQAASPWRTAEALALFAAVDGCGDNVSLGR